MAKIVLGVTSSVSIYKSCEVLRGFRKAGHEVQVLMTRNAALLIDWRPGPRACPGVLFRRTRPWLKATGEWRAEGSSLDAAGRATPTAKMSKRELSRASRDIIEETLGRRS